MLQFIKMTRVKGGPGGSLRKNFEISLQVLLWCKNAQQNFKNLGANVIIKTSSRNILVKFPYKFSNYKDSLAMFSSKFHVDFKNDAVQKNLQYDGVR